MLELEEVVESLPESFLLNIELKAEGFGDGGLPEKVADLVDDLGLLERAVLSSFSPLLLLRARGRNPRLKTGLLFEPDASPFLQTASSRRGRPAIPFIRTTRRAARPG